MIRTNIAPMLQHPFRFKTTTGMIGPATTGLDGRDRPNLRLVQWLLDLLRHRFSISSPCGFVGTFL